MEGLQLQVVSMHIEVWRRLDHRAIVWLTKLFNLIFGQTRCLKNGEEVY